VSMVIDLRHGFLEGGQSWPQPPFRRPEPAESRLRAELPALQTSYCPAPDSAAVRVPNDPLPVTLSVAE
jgi:hypothetical protein